VGSAVTVNIPGGGGGASYLYVNVAFVHPNGNDATAVLGNYNLPFATIGAAFSNANGLAMATTPVNNGVIEVWPGPIGSMPTLATVQSGTLPSTAYNYTVTAPLFNTVNWKLHLKPGVHIQYASTTGGALFILGTNTTVTITSDEDRTSSIECLATDTPTSFFANLNNNAKLYVEGISIYDALRFGNGDLAYSVYLKNNTIFQLRNSVLVTTDAVMAANGQIPARIQNIFDSSGTNCIEIQDSEVTMYTIQTANTFWSTHIGILTASTSDPEPMNCRLIGSSFIHTRRGTPEFARFANAIYAGGTGNPIVLIDNCSFYISRNVVYNGWTPTSLSGVCVMADAGTLNNYVYYIGRSVHNYDNTAFDPYSGGNPWIEMSGYAISAPFLGFAGFGLLEYYDLIPRHNF
jgi:hypothetical protein